MYYDAMYNNNKGNKYLAYAAARQPKLRHRESAAAAGGGGGIEEGRWKCISSLRSFLAFICPRGSFSQSSP